VIIETDDGSTINTHRPQSQVEVTFNNVTITIPAANAKQAYAVLCEALDPLGAEWTTDTYTVDDGEEKDTVDDGEEKDTRDLF